MDILDRIRSIELDFGIGDCITIHILSHGVYWWKYTNTGVGCCHFSCLLSHESSNECILTAAFLHMHNGSKKLIAGRHSLTFGYFVPMLINYLASETWPVSQVIHTFFHTLSIFLNSLEFSCCVYVKIVSISYEFNWITCKLLQGLCKLFAKKWSIKWKKTSIFDIFLCLNLTDELRHRL